MLNHPFMHSSAAAQPRRLARLIQLTSTVIFILALWQGAIAVFELPSFILPSPQQVFLKALARYDILLAHGWVTLQEILFGLLLGLSCGLFFALQMLLFQPVKRWLLPVLIISQAIPVFALAPIFMLWLGYGIASKVVIAAIIIFFPMTTCAYDGLTSTPQGYLDLAKTMNATRWQTLIQLQIPHALPSIASGIRVACVVAPIGAITGEWVGSSSGLGYLMLQANARMMISEMFAALLVLSLISLSLYFSVDLLLKRWISWKP
ncbi:ABC transporter permease [Vibrio sp. ABG19]|uniref:ABC transporter permease n=1 Tax=Vibrio sp. ABG19 TaxID=2817385 RepID=UPI00249DBF60|nr:ABC transporter permease [Vibrio sp. ABG19]WGY46812.1 ABC transporter permease [Vibrio sp. ABG19]